MTEGYWMPLYKDIVDLVTDNTITVPQFGLYSSLGCLADYKTGDVVVSLVKLQRLLQWGASDDTLRRDLHKLRDAGLIEFQVRERQRSPWAIHVPAAQTGRPSGTSSAANPSRVEGGDLRQSRGSRAAVAPQMRGSRAAGDTLPTAAVPQIIEDANPQSEVDSAVVQLPQRGTHGRSQEVQVEVENEDVDELPLARSARARVGRGDLHSFGVLARSTEANEVSDRGALLRAHKLISQSFSETNPGCDDDALAAEIEHRADLYRERFPNMRITPSALCKHWVRVLSEKPKPKLRHSRGETTDDALRQLNEACDREARGEPPEWSSFAEFFARVNGQKPDAGLSDVS